MRGKVTDQDLTNYALNELAPDDRFYVESMLAVSDECRHDVYRLLDLSEMLKEGFEQEEDAKTILLNDEQRTKVLSVPRWHWRGIFQKAAAIAILAAGTAYAVKQPGVWQRGGEKLVKTGEVVKDLVGDFQAKGLPASAEEFVARIRGNAKPSDGSELQYISAPAVCTPPTLFVDMPAMPELMDM